MKKFLFKPSVGDIEDTLKITRNDTCYLITNTKLVSNKYNPIADFRDEEQIAEDLEAKELEKALRRL